MDHIRTCRDNGEESKVIGNGIVVCFETGGGTTILECVDSISLFVGRTHGGFDAAIGQKSGQHDVADRTLRQQEIQIGRCESTQTGLSLDDDLVLLGFHSFAEIGTPFTGRECLCFLDTRKNAIWCVGNLLVSLQERERERDREGKNRKS